MSPAAAITHWSRRALSRCARHLPAVARRRQTFPPLFEQVHQARASVDQAVLEMEKRFLDISGTLEKTTQTGQELVQHGEALISLALGQGGGQITIESTAEHIWEAIEFVERNVRNGDDLLTQLTRSSEQIKRTLAAEQSLARTLSPLTYVQTLFRVESAACSPEVQTMFQALVHEIDQVRQNVEAGFREKFQLIRQIQSILDQAIAQLLGKQTEARESVARLRTHLTRSMEAMKASYEQNRDRDTRLASESQAVTKATGQVVMSLQFFDILTQKLQHIYKILADMEAGYRQPAATRPEAGRRLRQLQQSGQVCGAQLATIVTELNQAGYTINEGLNQIVVQMAKLDEECIALRDIDNVTTGVDGAVQILLESLADVHLLVKDAEHHAIEAHQAIQPIGGMTTNFTSFIRQLSFEIQLIGLNAEVQAAHVGAGTGLEVLSAQTSAISRETTHLSTDLAISLDTLTAGLDQVVSSFGRIREENAAYSQTLAATIAEDNSSLHDYRNSALKVLGHLADLLPQLQEHIQNAAHAADFTTFATEPLARLSTAIATLTTEAQNQADRAGRAADDTPPTDHLLKHYTMRSEVDVHHATLAAQPAATPPPPLRPDEKVELWDGETAMTAVLTDAPTQPQSAPAGGETSATVPTTPAPLPAIISAGTTEPNVDLWLEEPPAAPANTPHSREPA